VQELAYTLKNGLTYVEHAVARGLDVDQFAPRLSFFFNAQIDFFEEIAKYRAARRIWARELRETFGAKDERSWLMRFHTQTAGVSLTAQQPLNNIVRTAIEALAGVLGGTQSLHTNSYDEALALPTEEAVRIAVRTQQIIAHETGVANTIDPLGGAYFVEALTDEMERRPTRSSPGSTSSEGWSRRSRRTTRSARSPTPPSGCRRSTTRASACSSGSTTSRRAARGDRDAADRSGARARADRPGQTVRADREPEAAERALAALEAAAATDANLMPLLLDCARAMATEGEMIETLQRVFGTYSETPVF
jgi:methylmalonyl-CoA mutase N-terminal domain/subunit